MFHLTFLFDMSLLYGKGLVRPRTFMTEPVKTSTKTDRGTAYTQQRPPQHSSTQEKLVYPLCVVIFLNNICLNITQWHSTLANTNFALVSLHTVCAMFC